MENALPAFLPEGKLLPFLRVNSLSVNAGVKDCYAPGEAEETARETLVALLQGTAEGMRSAVTATATGAAVGLYVPGHYTLRLGREKAKLTLATSGERVTLYPIHEKSRRGGAETAHSVLDGGAHGPGERRGRGCPGDGKNVHAAPDVPGWGCDYAASSPERRA